jgi:16S rRNA (uracil1498-N3)-methyltransferase
MENETMANPWFLVGRVPESGDRTTLDREEAKHALGARRLGEGDTITLFDGRGRVGQATIEARAKDGAVPVRVASVQSLDRPTPLIHLRTALPKGDRQADLFDMAAQLGVASIGALRCRRSVAVDPGGRDDRRRRILAEACKQARWPWIPELRPEVDLATALSEARSAGSAIAIAHPAHKGTFPEADSVTLLVGPEGGFTDEEVAAATSAGATPLGLGPSILRTELAAAVGIALLRQSA